MVSRGGEGQFSHAFEGDLGASFFSKRANGQVQYHVEVLGRKTFTLTPFSIIQQTESSLTAAGVISRCVVTKLIAAGRNCGRVDTFHIDRLTLIHV